MSGETESVLKPLPAEKLCNKWGDGNPINGDGPLGNKNKEKMHYIGSDREELVKTVQMMLKTLGYDLGTSGPDENGIDGYFGDTTEEYVIDFQRKNKDWDGETLKEEGLIGPRTADALDRAMVGKQYEGYEWYDHYQTPEKLVEDKPYHTSTTDYLNSGLLIKAGKVKEGKVFLVGQIIETVGEATLTIRLIDIYGQHVGNAKYRLEVENRQFEGYTKADGILSHKISKNTTTGKLILDTIIYDLIIEDIGPAGTIKGALVRLGNLGYLTTPLEEVQKMGNKEGEQNREQLQLALVEFQKDYGLDTSGELNEPTVRKLEGTYGS